MAYTNTIAILIQAKDEATAVLKSTASTVESTAKSVSTFGASATKIGTGLTKEFTLPIVGVGLASVKMAMDFNQSMELIRTQAGASQEEVDSLSQSVLDMARVVGAKPEELAKGLFFIESSGYRGAKALDILKLAAEGAAVGQADLADTSNALTSVMNSQIKGAESATSAMGLLNAIVGQGKMHFQDLNGAIGTGFLATAKMFGVDLQSAGAALDLMTRQGQGAEESATRLRMGMVLMAAPTERAAKVLEGIGFSANEVQAGSAAMTDALAKAHVTTNDLSTDLAKPNGLGVALRDLRDHLVKAGVSAPESAAIISRAFGGGRTSGPIIEMVQHLDEMDGIFNQVGKDAGKFGDDWAAQQKQAKQKWNENWAGIQADMITIGNKLLPTVSKWLDTLSRNVDQWTKDWDKLSPAAKKTIEYIAGSLAVGGPVLIAIGAVIAAVGNIGGAIKLLGTPIKWMADQVVAMAARSMGVEGISGVSGAFKALGSQLAQNPVMGGIVIAGALADIGLVSKAISTVRGAIKDMNNAANAAWNELKAIDSAGSSILNSANQLKITLDQAYTTQQKIGYKGPASVYKQSVGGQNVYTGGYASGTEYAPGGRALVGEKGPEYVDLPRGAKVVPADDTRKMMHGFTFHQTNHIYNNNDMTAANRELGWRLARA